MPDTLGYLPVSGPDRHDAMIAAFGIADEPEPGQLHLNDESVVGIHLTLLRRDGRKAGTGCDKITVGTSIGMPIVLAPMNDLLGLAVAEGIENGLSVHEATGLGVWCAGSATRMQALVPAIPNFVDFVTIAADGDGPGLKHAADLQARLFERGLHVVVLAADKGAA